MPNTNRIDPDELAAFIGDRIRQKREYMKLTLDETAAAIGMRKSNLSKIERGHVRISAVDVALLAEYLRVRVEFFYGEVGEGSTDADLLCSLPDDLRRVAVEQIRALDEYARRRLDSPNISD
jgi:transcriptional regulator with XRE-family HTH domain